MFLIILICLKILLKRVLKIGEDDLKSLGNPSIIASSIFGITYSILLYKIKSNQELDIKTLYKEYENVLFLNYN